LDFKFPIRHDKSELDAKLRYICALVTGLCDTITLGVQSSGDDDRTGEHVLELRKLLAAHCKGPYSDEISEFALVLRVGGNMQEFDFEGCECIRRNRKDRYITVDLGFLLESGAACPTAKYADTSLTVSRLGFSAAYTVSRRTK